MALSALDDLEKQPDETDLTDVLGDAVDPWQRLEGWLASEECGVDCTEWMTSGRKYGWALRAKRGKRTIVYLIPQHGSFLVGIVLGDRAVEAARAATVSPAAREALDSAKRYMEGTGIRLPVSSMEDLGDIETLVRIKLRY